MIISTAYACSLSAPVHCLRIIDYSGLFGHVAVHEAEEVYRYV